MPIPVVYPPTLPMPQAAPFKRSDRRVMPGEYGELDVRAFQRDRTGTQDIVFPAFSGEQMAIFHEWWKTMLVYGGCWFAATWPLPEGIVPAVRRFLETPRREYLGNGFWRVSAQMEVRGVGMLPQRYPLPLLAMHFDQDWIDESGHPITSPFWGFGAVPSVFTTSGQRFGPGAYYNDQVNVEPLLSDNRGSLDFNVYGQWQIKAFFSVNSAGTSDGVLVSLFAPMTAAPITGSTGNSAQFILRMLRGGSGWYPAFIYASIDPGTLAPSGEVLSNINNPGGPMPEFNYDEVYFGAVVGDATSTRLYIGRVVDGTADLIADDRTSFYPPGSRPMRYVPGSPFTNQHFAVGKLAAGGTDINIWPTLSAWTAEWEGMIDDLHIAHGPGSIEFTGATIVVPTVAFKV